MKKFYCLLVLCFVVTKNFSQTLFTYGDNAVSKEEFLKAYNKNKSAEKDSEKALREYLDLYAKFKLKVRAAQNLRLDTLEQIQYDLQSFRSQIEEGYLNDEKGVSQLVDEAFDRSQKDIRVMHIYVTTNAKMTPADTTVAYNEIQEAYSSLLKGKTDYVDIAGELSAQYKMVIKAADLGFVSVFSLPYEYENIVYGLKPGQFCKPYRSKNAWHIFIDLSERKPFGKWRTAQILFATPPNATAQQLDQLKHKADSVYNRLVAGEDFAEMALRYSNDKFTYMKAGEMAEFGVGKFSPEFEDKIVELKNDGDISKPIFSGYGYHIVKRLQQTPVPSDNKDENVIYTLKQQVLGDPRINVPKQKFVKDILAQTAYKRNSALSDDILFRWADSVANSEKEISTPINSSVVFSFQKSVVKGIDWLNFVKENRQQNGSKAGSNKELLDKFISVSALDYYKKHLEEYNSDFKYQVQEFKEGNMLFEIMERNVWTRAANDSAGLQEHYKKNMPNYLWGPSAEVLVFNCSSKEAADNAINNLKAGEKWTAISQESNATIQADSGRYEITQLQVSQDATLNEGYISTVTVNSQDKTASFVKVLHLYPANQQRSFEEARGLVINEYQNYLEEKWIDELKSKYPITVNEKVFKSLLK